jgi:hypothetical protein
VGSDSDADDREARRARQRRPESYESVSAWFADYRGFVPLPMAHALSQLTATGMSFHDAYLKLLREGRIVEIEPLPRDPQE